MTDLFHRKVRFSMTLSTPCLGLDNGNIIILNTQTGQIEREFSVHCNTVK